MNVLALVPALYDTSPGQRFRVEQWARHLERTGSRFTFVPFESRALHGVIYQPGRYGLKTALMLEAFARRFRILALARSNPRIPLVVLAMGETGFATRVLSTSYCGLFTYAAPSAVEGTAA